MLLNKKCEDLLTLTNSVMWMRTLIFAFNFQTVWCQGHLGN